MLGWAVATLAFVLVTTLVPILQLALKTTSLSGREWALAAGAALVGMFRMEVGKLLGSRIERRS